MFSEASSDFASRLTIHRLSTGSDSGTFAEDVRRGLTSSPKVLPPKYFYDDLGSALFEAICRLPEYYLTRAEGEILREYSGQIVASIEGPVRLMELGSGSAEKTRYLIEALLARQAELHYLPVDISDVSLDRSSAVLLHSYPQLRITAYAADYFTALRVLAEKSAGGPGGERTMALFLGSNIGNFNAEESLAFLREVRRTLHPGDGLLIGADLKKSVDILVRAYDDALGVTSAFDRNLLLRINRELGADFDISRFQHKALYNESAGRIESHLVSLSAQTISIKSLDLDISFERDETIHTENSYKFDREQLAGLARESGFSLSKSWLDSNERFSFNLFAAA